MPAENRLDPPAGTDRSPLVGGQLPSRRGGRRPGAGAPKGNLNGLKHGRRSRQFAEIGHLIAAGSPKVREALISLAYRSEKKARKADEVAADLIVRIFAHARDIAEGKASPGPFARLLREADEALPPAVRSDAPLKALRGAQSKKTAAPQTRAKQKKEEITRHPIKHSSSNQRSGSESH